MKLEPVDLQRLAGITSPVDSPDMGANMSITGTEKAQLMRQHDIRPGTPEWFQLWFSRPYLTGEPPVSK